MLEPDPVEPRVDNGIMLTVPCPMCEGWHRLLPHERGFECLRCGCIITRNALRYGMARTRTDLLETLDGVRRN